MGQKRESPPIFSNVTTEAVPTGTLVGGHMSLLAWGRVGTFPLKWKTYAFSQREIRATKRCIPESLKLLISQCPWILKCREMSHPLITISYNISYWVRIIRRELYKDPWPISSPVQGRRRPACPVLVNPYVFMRNQGKSRWLQLHSDYYTKEPTWSLLHPPPSSSPTLLTSPTYLCCSFRIQSKTHLQEPFSN